MCDEHFEEDVRQYLARRNVTRREFGATAAGVGMMAMLPRVANAQAVT